MDVDMNVEETLFTKYITRAIEARATGASEKECLRNYPRDVYFVGNLRSVQTVGAAAAGARGQMEIQRKIAPFAIGAQFMVALTEDPMAIQVKASWAVYYRVLPSLAEQRQHMQQALECAEGETDSDGPCDEPGDVEYLDEKDALTSTDVEESFRTEQPWGGGDARLRRKRRRTPKDTLFVKFRKIVCNAAGTIKVFSQPSGAVQVDASDLRNALDAEMARAVALARADPDRLRTAGAPSAKVEVPQTAIQTEAAYRAFVASLTTEVIPSWGWKCDAKATPESAGAASPLLLSLELSNNSLDDANPHREPFIFDPQLVLTFPDGALLPFELDLAPKGFRYDRRIWGRGFNCGIERLESSPPAIRTTHMPVYRQLRLTTRTRPAALFQDLAMDPLPVLRSILSELEGFRAVWERARRDYVAADPTWESRSGADFDADRSRFEGEIVRFRRGIEVLETNANALAAFRLMNETFQRAGANQAPGKRRDRWRLFQIAFILTQVPGITALDTNNPQDLAERRFVDILYFPTGGGKTEAYLGVLVFHCFFDRLRGKRLGTTAWIRFPLRLLTLQQTQRLAEIICTAELVRRAQTDPRLHSADVDGFSVGYFVGEGGSPNEIANPQRARFAGPQVGASWAKACDPRERQDWKRVVYCPACRTKSVQVDFDPATVRVIHACTNKGCPFPDGRLPVIVVDNEIYRYLPTVLIGTIDKLAVIGNQRKFSQLFGRVDGRCQLHGFYKGKCSQKDCSDIRLLDKRVPPGLTGPSLFIQDELHLLKEGLGTFDSHYETFLQRLRNEFGDPSMLKIIASSATVEAFERQIEHLYGKGRTDARVFPCPGPTLTDSFYAETQSYPQRLFIGVLPHNKTLFNSILELLDYYHRELSNLERLPANSPNPYGGQLVVGTQDWRQFLDAYKTSLTYFLAQRDLDSISTDIESDLNPNLEHDGLAALNKLELTGATRTDDVTRILERLETAGLNEPHDCVLATSMISHGVDIDRLNAMFFYGMPRQNAEYIQASSRVGRSHVGLVFTVMHPMRERDRSHYTYFAKYHEFLGLLIEPVAINRWAKYSINRTLPGLFMAVLLQRLATAAGAGGSPDRYYMIDFVKQRIADGSIRPDAFVPLLEDAYMVAKPTVPGEASFQAEIQLRVRQFLDQILASGSTRFVSEALIPKPMRSLRDVDEAITITLDDDGSAWAARQR
ncbi:MAG: hypothetical protein KatS3mg004_3845 [Bryobacteraceae bacterium]|nr:MAG: hypothetical protein KatS3mg004_3845 [Bryobacteraceae bacterium]